MSSLPRRLTLNILFHYIGGISSNYEGDIYSIPADPFPDIHIGLSSRFNLQQVGICRISRNPPQPEDAALDDPKFTEANPKTNRRRRYNW